jgi:hypothetical protein
MKKFVLSMFILLICISIFCACSVSTSSNRIIDAKTAVSPSIAIEQCKTTSQISAPITAQTTQPKSTIQEPISKYEAEQIARNALPKIVNETKASVVDTSVQLVEIRQVGNYWWINFSFDSENSKSFKIYIMEKIDIYSGKIIEYAKSK